MAQHDQRRAAERGGQHHQQRSVEPLAAAHHRHSVTSTGGRHSAISVGTAAPMRAMPRNQHSTYIAMQAPAVASSGSDARTRRKKRRPNTASSTAAPTTKRQKEMFSGVEAEARDQQVDDQRAGAPEETGAAGRGHRRRSRIHRRVEVKCPRGTGLPGRRGAPWGERRRRFGGSMTRIIVP